MTLCVPRCTYFPLLPLFIEPIHKTICYFNNLQENRNSPELFLESIRQQLINRYQLTNLDKDDLSTLLVKATEKLTTNEKLMFISS
jgi:hypothetical protein